MKKHPSQIVVTSIRMVLAVLAMTGVMAVQSLFAATSFLDLNGTTSGFGTTGSPTLTGTFWTTDTTGVAAPVAFPLANDIKIGNVASDFSGSTISLNMDNANSITGTGLTIVANNVNFTLAGTANCRWNVAFAWSVAGGSSMTVSDTRQGFDTGNTAALKGWNYNSKALTLSGGGTFNFPTPLGCNDSALVTENMSGGAVNLQMSATAPSGTGNFSGGFTLTAGTLNFASAGSVNQFFGFTAGKNFSINGGTIDNTSGSAIGPFNWAGGGGISIGGDFTFTGSNPLDLGTAGVTISGSTRQITASASTLTLGGAIGDGGSGFGLTKAGNGTLKLSGASTYTGATTISAGSLLIGSGGSLASGSAVSIGAGTLAGAGTINGAVSTTSSSAQINQETNYLATGNTVGTLALASSLDMSSGGACYLDLSTTYNSGNDLITVGGSLTLAGGGTTFHINALSGAANLDTTADYILIQGSGAPSGTVNATPVWDGTPPGNSANFAVQINGNNVVLHNTSSTAFSVVTAGASPSSLTRYQTTLLSANITNGTPPYTVTVNASSVGGSSSLSMVQDASQPAGTYTFTNSITPSAGTSLGGKSLPVSATDSASGTASGSISLVIVGASQTWNGNVNGNWNTTDANWQGSLTYVQGDFATFNDTLTGTTNVNLAVDVSPGSVTVNNTLSNYVFTGTGKLSGTTGLTKQGSGTLTLDNSGNNDFSGGITISAGTLQVGKNDANGNLPSSGNISDNGTLLFNNSANITVANVISGSGTLVQMDTNVVTLSRINTYTGTTTITNGTIKVNNFTGLGATNGSVTITNGGTLDLGGMATANVAGGFGLKQFYLAGSGFGGNGVIINSVNTNQQNAFVNVTLVGNTTLGGLGRFDLRNNNPTLDLAGFTLTKTGACQISMVSPTTTSGNAVINQGILSWETTPIFSGSGTITVNAGGFVGEFKDTPGSFTRNIVLNGGGTTNLSGNSGCYLDAPILLTANSTMGSSGGNQIFNGVISDGGNHFGITKAGLGTNLLAAANTYSGDTIVIAGRFGLTNAGSIASSPHIIMAGGTMLDVSNVVSTFTLASGQTLSNSSSTVTLNGSVNTSSGILGLTYASSTPSFTMISGTLTLSSGTTFYVNNTGAALTAGSYKVISAASPGVVSFSSTAPSVTVGGNGLAAGLAASLQITSSELYVVVASSSPPRLSTISLSGTTLNINATNGTPGATWTLMQSTNLAIPFSQWITNRVLSFDGSGNLTTNIVNVATNSQTYYILKQ